MKKMLMFLTVLAFLMTSAVSAQTTFDLGFKVGGNRAKMSVDDDSTTYLNAIAARFVLFTGAGGVGVDPDARIGFVGGAFLSINTSPTFSIQPEVLYSVKGVEKKLRYNYNNTDFETVLQIEMTYLEIPVLLKYKFPSEGKIRPSLYVGPALGFNLDGTFSAEEGVQGGFADDLGDIDIANLKSTEFSAVVGGELGVALGNTILLLDLRYTQGLTKAFEDASFATAIVNNEWAFVNTAGEADDVKNSSFSVVVGISFPLGGGQ